jgi:hypothetical protein
MVVTIIRQIKTMENNNSYTPNQVNNTGFAGMKHSLAAGLLRRPVIQIEARASRLETI